MNELGINRFDEYIKIIENPEHAEEQQLFCNSLTTNLTSFFREHHHFDQFESELRCLLERNPIRLRIWSAGCSTGQEAYSIALLLSQLQTQSFVPDAKILATDIDTRVLDTARKGRYELDDTTDAVSNSYSDFLEIGKSHLEIDQSVKDLISFKQLNLLGDWPMKGPFDFIFCRNVIIYFSEKSKSELIERFAKILRPGGILFLGHSETILGQHPNLQIFEKTSYRRT